MAAEDQREVLVPGDELLPDLLAVVHAAVLSGHPVERLYRAVRALRVLRTDFYRPSKRVPPWMGERLNARMLAIWFMDDGYLRVRPGRRRPQGKSLRE